MKLFNLDWKRNILNCKSPNICTLSFWSRLLAFCLVFGAGIASILGSNDGIEESIRTKWVFKADSAIISSPAIGSDGTIYVGSIEGTLYAINPDRSLKWSYHIDQRDSAIISSPAIGSDGTIYVGSQENLYAINPDGSLKWGYPIAWAPFYSSPAIGSDGTIYIGSNDGSLYNINPDGGTVWPHDTAGAIYSSPAIGCNGTIYVGSSDGNLYAINPDRSLSLKWSYDTGEAIYSSPSIGSDGTIYAGSNEDNLYAINPDGSLKWIYDMSRVIYTRGNTEVIQSSPAIRSDGTIFMCSRDALYAITPGGLLKWNYDMGQEGPISSSLAIGRDGTIYVGSRARNLYAIKGNGHGLADAPWPMFHHDLEHTGLQPGSTPSLPPTDVAAIAGNEEVIINWRQASGATSYNIYWATAPGVSTYDNKISGVTSPYVHTGLTNGTVYYYVITATNACGESDVSSEVSSTPQATGFPPSPPTNVATVAGDEESTVNWDPVSGATSYNIYWATSPGVTTSDTKISGVTSSYSHTGLTNGTIYYYVITAENSYGESSVSSEVEATPVGGTPPPPPINVAVVAGDEEATVNWDPVSGATSYNIYWSTSSGVTTSDTKISSVTSPYTHTGLTNGTPYYYVITTENSYGESSVSSEVEATPAAGGTPPPPPTNVAAMAGDEEATVSWDPVSGATSYNIYWSTSPGVTTSDTKISGVTSPYAHTSLTNGIIYYYVIAAENSYGESSVSSEVDATPLASWAKTYGGASNDWPRSIQQTSDGGHIVSGRTLSFGAGNNDMWVLKLNPDGTVAWEKTYGGTGDDRGESILQTPDGGYIVAGINGERADIWALKLDSDGTVAWQKTYDSIAGTGANAIQRTADNGYIVAGFIDLLAMGGKDFIVLKLNSTGTVAWQKDYGGASGEGTGVDSIQQTSDGGYIVLGNTVSFGSGSNDIWVLKLSSTGTVTWQKTYRETTTDWAKSIQQTLDGGYIVAGQTDSFGAGSYDAWILKLNSTGGVTWQKTYGGTDSDVATYIRQTSDGGYIVTGNTDSFGAGSNDAWVLKLTSDGAVTWQKSYGGASDDWGYSVQETADGDYIVAVYTNSFGAGNNDFWVLKLDSDGTLGCGLDADTSAVVADTTVTGLNTTVTGTDYTPTVIDTTITGQNSSATINTQCP